MAAATSPDAINVIALVVRAYREHDLEEYDRWMEPAIEILSDGQWASLVRALEELDELHGSWWPYGA